MVNLLEPLVGREMPLDVLHGEVRRSAQAVRNVVEYGTMLVGCSDEFNTELRTSFDRDVARPLLPHVQSRIFAVANLAGRVEPTALQLADQHFTVKTRRQGAKALIVEIAAHVGRRTTADGWKYGEVDRFGDPSPCCGALFNLINPPAASNAVRHPWFEQLTAFFGPERLATLRADTGPYRMVAAAIVHAVLQAESSLVDLLREPPPTNTHVLVLPLVVINQRGSERAILVGCHHILCEDQVAHVQRGFSLRSTPSALQFDMSSGTLTVVSPFDEVDGAPEPAHKPHRPHKERPTPRSATAALERLSEPAVEKKVLHTAKQVERLRSHPNALRVYSRPLLRALVQGISVVAPEVGLAALLSEGIGELIHAHHLHDLVQRGPTSEEARRALLELEPRIEQLGHKQAQEVLESLLARQRKAH
jgi:hypothetical protein